MSQYVNNISKLSPTTGVWSYTYNGTITSSSYPAGLYGFDGQNVLAYTYVYQPSTNVYNDSFLTLFPTTGGSGTLGVPLVGSATAPIAATFCTAGTSASNCELPVYGLESRATFDSANSRWLLLGTNTPFLLSVATGAYASSGAVQSVLTLPRSAEAFAYQSQGTPTLYYCAQNGHLYKNDLNGNDTLIPFPFAGMTCTGRTLLLNTIRNSLIFIYGENSLYGIGEYSLN